MQELETFKAATPVEVEEFRIRILGKKGILTALFEEFKMLIRLKKKEFGKQLNLIKNKALKRSTHKKKNLRLQVTYSRERMI